MRNNITKKEKVIIGFIDAKIKTYSDRAAKAKTQKDIAKNAEVVNAMFDLKIQIQSLIEIIK